MPPALVARPRGAERSATDLNLQAVAKSTRLRRATWADVNKDPLGNVVLGMLTNESTMTRLDWLGSSDGRPIGDRRRNGGSKRYSPDASTTATGLDA